MASVMLGIGSLAQGMANGLREGYQIRMWMQMERYYKALADQAEKGTKGTSLDPAAIAGPPGGIRMGDGGGGGGAGFERLKQNIGQFESGGDYGIVNKKSGALGKYQVMPANLGQWTREALGHELTADEFLKDHDAQEQVADYKMKEYYKQYGTYQDVASAWFTGKPWSEGQHRPADAMGTTPQKYIDVAMKGVQEGTDQPSYEPVATTVGGGKETTALNFGPKDVYKNIPDVDEQGQSGQVAKFMQWNNDPVGNSAKNLASVHPDLQAIVNRAQKDNPNLKFVVAYGKGTPEQEKQAKDWGWSQTDQSNHLKGSVVDLWPLDKNGNVVFDKGQQQQINKAIQKAAGELGQKVRWGGLQSEGGANKGFRDAPNFELENPRTLTKAEQAKTTAQAKLIAAPPLPPEKPSELKTTQADIAAPEAQPVQAVAPTISSGVARAPTTPDPYWRANPPLSSVQRVQQLAGATTAQPATGIPAPADQAQPSNVMQWAQQGLASLGKTLTGQGGAQPITPAAGGGGAGTVSPDLTMMRMQMAGMGGMGGGGGGGDQGAIKPLNLPEVTPAPERVANAPDVDQWVNQNLAQAGQQPQQGLPPLLQVQDQPTMGVPTRRQDQGDQGDETLAAAKGGVVWKGQTGGLPYATYQPAAGQSALTTVGPSMGVGGAGSALYAAQQGYQPFGNFGGGFWGSQAGVPYAQPLSGQEVAANLATLNPAQQQWYQEQVANANASINPGGGRNWYYNPASYSALTPSPAPATPAAAPVPAPAATPAAAPATVAPATTAVTVPGGSDALTSGQLGGTPKIGTQWVTGQSGTITPPSTKSTSQTPFGEPASYAPDYYYSNTQNIGGTNYGVDQYGNPTTYSGYRQGGIPTRGYEKGGPVWAAQTGGLAAFMSPSYIGPTLQGGWQGTPYAQLAPNQQQWADTTKGILGQELTAAQQDAAYWASGGTNPNGPNPTMQYWNQITPMPTAQWPAPAPTAAPPPAAAPAVDTTVAPATTAVTVPGGSDALTSGQLGGTPKTGTQWVTGQTGTIAAPDTSSATATPFGQPASYTPNYTYANTQNIGGTNYGVDQYGNPTTYSGYQRGGNVRMAYQDAGGVDPASLGPPPGLPMGGQGQQPIPPVYYNRATYSPYGAGVGRGVSYASAPTLVGQGIPTYQKGGDIHALEQPGAGLGGLSQASQDDTEMDPQTLAYYAPQPTTGSSADMPAPDTQEVAALTALSPRMPGGGGMMMPRPRMSMGALKPPSYGASPTGIDLSPSWFQPVHVGEEEIPSDVWPKPDGAPDAAPMIMDRDGNPSPGLTEAIGSGLRWIAQTLGLGRYQTPQGITTDPGQQAARRDFVNGVGAASNKTMGEMMDTIDPSKSLNRELRVGAAIEAAYKHAKVTNPDQAARLGASMAMWVKQIISDYGDEAARRYYSGDMQGTIDAIKAGSEFLPNGMHLDGEIDKDGNISVSGKKLNGVELWKMTQGPEAILGVILGMKDGSLAWQEMERMAGKYDPDVKADLDAQQQQARDAALQRARGGGGTYNPWGGTTTPASDPNKPAPDVTPAQFTIPGSGATVNAPPVTGPGAGIDPSQTPGALVTAQGGVNPPAPAPTIGSQGPALPTAPTGRSIFPQVQTSPAVDVASRGVLPPAPTAAPAPAPEDDLRNFMPANAAQPVSNEEEQNLRAQAIADVRKATMTPQGVPMRTNPDGSTQVITPPSQPNYDLADPKDRAGLRAEYAENVRVYNKAIDEWQKDANQQLIAKNKTIDDDIRERRADAQATLRQAMQAQQQAHADKAAKERERFTQEETTKREVFSQTEQTGRVLLQGQVTRDNDAYKANLGDKKPLNDEQYTKKLTGIADATPATKYTALVGLLAGAVDPTYKGGAGTDPQTTLQNAGYTDRAQQEFLARSLENGIIHSPHVDPRTVAQGIISASQGTNHTVFSSEYQDKEGKAIAGPYGIRYVVTTDTPMGSVSFTMLPNDFAAMKRLGEANAKAYTEKTIAPVVTGSQFTPWGETQQAGKPTSGIPTPLAPLAPNQMLPGQVGRPWIERHLPGLTPLLPNRGPAPPSRVLPPDQQPAPYQQEQF